ncbi:MAG: Xaa-Pro dipeptidyl-peptidase [Acidobacteria bacterium]|nr:MAG: Xaa-Pro dipeptidyl-peptidase [Acidobacteriota bacterium]REJ98026.1 MAG: Xaa-Pro dipeptidyl-peptidase [Acidobacteriota bacterium]REK16769.1 MAG: Xaa-Pro dipeptidyl-peptidase [Acidobacteriota bacterium]REK42680.1 MAG: Xaa-Pro dipeptidyl-peptidase [Acidobacteriota bacterium]
MKTLRFLLVATLLLVPAYAQQTGPVFKDGEAQIVDAFSDPESWIREDLWVETEFDTDGDGRMDRMHVSVTRPRQTETEGLKLPVVYETSPYYSGTAGFVPGLFWNIRHNLGEPAPEPRVHPEVTRRGERPIISTSQEKTWIPRGYIVVHSSSPGTGLSDGSPTVGGDNESLAPKAVVEWLAGKDNGYKERTGTEKVMASWSTGKIGMTGTSYNGTLPVAAATTGVKGLEAIIPIAPNTSYYHYYRSHGLVRNPGGYPGEDVDVLYDFIHSGDESKRARNNQVVRDNELVANMDRITGDYNDFWAGRDYLNDMKPFKAALLMSHGFNDWNVMPEHSYRIYEEARKKGVPVQIFYHQGGHGGPPPMKLMNRWFTRYLHGINNGVENDPKSWIVREDDEMSNPTSYPDYPHPEAQDVVLHLSKGSPESGGLSSIALPKQGTEKLVDNFSFSGDALAQAEFTNHRLMYVTPILSKPVHISGIARIKIRLSSSKPAANLSVWLVSLPWTEGRRSKITDNIITRGWADPQNYRSLTESEPLAPDRFYEMTFTLQPDDQVIKPGQRIGLMIFSSDRDFTLHPDPGTVLMVDVDATKLYLPIVGGQSAYDGAFENQD